MAHSSIPDFQDVCDTFVGFRLPDFNWHMHWSRFPDKCSYIRLCPSVLPDGTVAIRPTDHAATASSHTVHATLTLHHTYCLLHQPVMPWRRILNRLFYCTPRLISCFSVLRSSDTGYWYRHLRMTLTVDLHITNSRDLGYDSVRRSYWEKSRCGFLLKMNPGVLLT